jgi:hypothetical protein
VTVLFAGYAGVVPVVPEVLLTTARAKDPDCVQHFLAGWDGSWWNLSDLTSPVQFAIEPIGMDLPDVVRQTRRSLLRHGTRFLRAVIDEREVSWRVLLEGSPGQGFLDARNAFRRLMRSDRVNTWTVVQPNGTTRRLPVRCISQGPPTGPSGELFGWQHMDLELVAEEPFWRGDPVVGGPWANIVDTTPTFPTAATDTRVLHLRDGNGLSNAIVENPGDEPSYPEWTIDAPFTSAVLGVGEQKIVVPFNLDSGSLHTSPYGSDTSPAPPQSAVLNDGTDVTRLLSEASWAPIRAEEQVELAVSLQGTGSISLSMATYFHCAT